MAQNDSEIKINSHFTVSRNAEFRDIGSEERIEAPCEETRKLGRREMFRSAIPLLGEAFVKFTRDLRLKLSNPEK